MPEKIIRVLQVGMSTNYGGTEAIVYEIYRHIDKTKIQFDFLNVYDEPLAKQEWLESMGARIFPLKLKRREGYLKYLRGIKAFYRRHAQEFGAVTCNVQCLDQIAMAKFAKKFGIKKTIVHLHNANYGIQPSGLARIAIRWNKANCHRYVDRFVAVSSLAANWGFGKRDSKKAVILKHGIPVETMRFDEAKREKFRSDFGFGDADIIYGSAGRLDPQKNQAFLLEIYQEIARLQPNAKFVLLGRGPLKEEVIQAARNTDLGMRFHLIERVEDIGEFYAGIDCFFLPSQFEGLGLVLIEAQCSGLPCLASASVIPQEAKISNTLQFLSLQEGPKAWAKEAVSMKGVERESAYECVLRDGRAISDTAKAYCDLFL